MEYEYLAEIFNNKNQDHIMWIDKIKAEDFILAEGKARMKFSFIYRKSNDFKHINKNDWSVRVIPV